jgi:hypothetical protein
MFRQAPAFCGFRKTVALALGVLSVLACQTSFSQPGGAARPPAQDATPRTLSPFFTPATAGAKAVDSEGFLRRWLLLEPSARPFRSNAGFTNSFVRAAITTNLPLDQLTVVPKDGDAVWVSVSKQTLVWHALDSGSWNVRLYRLAYGLNKQTDGVLFWAVTVIDSPREMKNVRKAVGSNSASMWWLNGQEVVDLFGDRRMVADDCFSKRLTLAKGRNVIRGAVINGPGLSDFCVRFIDENGQPVKDLAVNLESAAQ